VSREDWRVIPVAVVVTEFSEGTVTVPVNVGLLDAAFVNELFTTADELLVMAVLSPSSLDCRLIPTVSDADCCSST
jgi:hypothetical protein